MLGSLLAWVDLYSFTGAQRSMVARLVAVRQVRGKIEVAGREPRWEFNKTALFERSAHIADVCARLLAALDTYHGLRQTLGPNLEAMTANSQVSRQPAKPPACKSNPFAHELGLYINGAACPRFSSAAWHTCISHLIVFSCCCIVDGKCRSLSPVPLSSETCKSLGAATASASTL